MRKCVGLMFACALATASAAVPDTTCRVIADHSGFVEQQIDLEGNHYYLDSGTISYSSWVQQVPLLFVTVHGYVGFDLTTIPDTALIQAATIFFCQHGGGGFPAVRPVELDYQQWTPDSVWTDVANGRPVGPDVTCQTGWNQAAFSSTGLVVLKAALPYDSVFFGLAYVGPQGDQGIAYGCDAPESLRPYLHVDYSLGVEEAATRGVRIADVATVVRSVLFLPEATSPKPQAASLMDATGRRVLDLRPGANDVSRLAPGVYFYRLVADNNTATQKVVKAK